MEGHEESPSIAPGGAIEGNSSAIRRGVEPRQIPERGPDYFPFQLGTRDKNGQDFEIGVYGVRPTIEEIREALIAHGYEGEELEINMGSLLALVGYINGDEMRAAKKAYREYYNIYDPQDHMDSTKAQS